MFSPLNMRNIAFIAAFLLPNVSLYARASSDTPSAVWDLGTVEPGRQYPTSITAANVSCRGKHDFSIDLAAVPWLHLDDRRPIRALAIGQVRAVAATVDTTNLTAGLHTGVIRVLCTTCPPPPACSQNVTSINVRVTIRSSNVEIPTAIKFEESETFTLGDELVSHLGYKRLVVSAGTYAIQFSADRPFGYATLDLAVVEKGPEAMTTPNPGGFGLRIRIASKKQGCQGGVGLRCGLVRCCSLDSSPTGEIDAIAYAASITVVNDHQLEVVFTQQVPWQALHRDVQSAK